LSLQIKAATSLGILKVVFEADARHQLLEHLQFSVDEIQETANELTKDLAGLSIDSSENKTPAPPPANNKQMSVNAEELVKKSLLVGNFEAAVNVCFESESYADSLLLASCGGLELWSKTQERYFTQESPKRPFLSIVTAIIRNQLDELVQESDTGS
jgi:protein transport protein SEC31